MELTEARALLKKDVHDTDVANIPDVRQRALSWWNNKQEIQQSFLANRYYPNKTGSG